jgi:UDP-N-acetylmuramoylalanine--D-glutamate ligase
MKNKNILVVGFGKSGKAMVDFLKTNNNIYIFDSNSKENYYNGIKIFNDFLKTKEYYFDILAMSPGVPTDIELVNYHKNNGSKIIGEIEIAYLETDAKFIGITGTNGKTTTTALTFEMFKRQFYERAILAGNIGIPAVEVAVNLDNNYKIITELSSFQLETVDTFKCNSGVILNLTEDHLNRHKTMDAYLSAKLNIFNNMDETNFIVLNYDDPILRKLEINSAAKIIYFSRQTILNKGVFVKNGSIYINFDKEIEVIKTDEIYIPGPHNLENALAAIALSYINGVSLENIISSLKEFKGVEHRLEYVTTHNGIDFINDSKATNPDSTIKAIESMKKPTILILGGLDKGSDFNPLFERLNDNIVGIVTFGQTKEKINEISINHGFLNVIVVNDLEEAIRASIRICKEDYSVLLSPACASWDMYENFEKRGKHFKEIIGIIYGEN